jgi:hypothetical protein
MSVFTQSEPEEGKKPICAVKLDMMNAYDRVEWVFLEQMMERMGFAQSWISMIMRCVSTVRFSVRLYGGLSEAFIPSEGSVKGIPCPPICSSFVLKVFPPC